MSAIFYWQLACWVEGIEKHWHKCQRNTYRSDSCRKSKHKHDWTNFWQYWWDDKPNNLIGYESYDTTSNTSAVVYPFEWQMLESFQNAFVREAYRSSDVPKDCPFQHQRQQKPHRCQLWALHMRRQFNIHFENLWTKKQFIYFPDRKWCYSNENEMISITHKFRTDFRFDMCTNAARL